MAGDVLFEEYTLEYGRDRLEMHVGAVEQGDRALVVDDLIATGGTLCAAMSLLGKQLFKNFQQLFLKQKIFFCFCFCFLLVINKASIAFISDK